MLSASAVLASSYGVEEGGTTTLYDVGGPNSGAVSWEWDTNYNGVNFVPRLTGQTPIFSAVGLDGPSSQTLALRVKDAQGVYSTITTAPLNIRNVAPVITAQVPSATAGAVTTLQVSVSDPGVDTINKWVLNWGDGTAAQTYAGSLPTLSHVYSVAGSYTVTATVTDEDGTHTQTLLGPGSMDPTFGVNGRLRDPLQGTETLDGTWEAAKTIVQPDGKILELSTFAPANNQSPLPIQHRLTRYNADGSVDSGFGTGGAIILQGYNALYSQPDPTFTLQPDGKILIFLLDQYGESVLSRYTSSGAIDTSFGSGGQVYFWDSSQTPITAMAVQSDGKILALTGAFNLYRYTATGDLDTTYDGYGHANLPNYDVQAENLGLALTSSGSAVVGGTEIPWSFAAAGALVTRITSTGLADTTFGSGGYVTNPIPGADPSEYIVINQFVEQSDGKMILAGTRQQQVNGNVLSEPVVLRVNSDGSPDTSFGSGTGCITLASGYSTVGIALQSDGKLVVATRGGGAVSAVRLNSNGAVDTSFGTAGMVTVPSGFSDMTSGVAISSDGEILLSGIEASATPVTFKLRSSAFTVAAGAPPPTATFSGGVVNEGASSATLQFTSVTGTGPFTYSYDFNNDGVFDLVTTSSIALVPSFFLQDGPSVLTMRGRVTASTGAFADFTTTVTVNNVAPTVTLGAMPVGAQEGTPIILTASATDPSTIDSAAGFSYQWTITSGGATVASTTTSIGNYFFTPPDNGTYSVSVSATDKDNGKSALSTSAFNAANVAPTAVFYTGLSTVPSGQTTTVGFNSFLDPSMTDVAAGFKFSFDYDNNGTFEVIDSTAPSATIPLSYLTGVASRTVRGRIKDKDGAFTDYTATIQIQYPPPTATFSGGSVNEGSSRNVTFSGAGSGLGPYTYSYDFDNDGTFEITNSTAVTATVPSSYLADGPGTRVVHGRVTAADGQFADYTTAVTINNVAPTATLTAATAVLNSPCTLSFINPVDPSPADTSAGFTYSYDFNNDGIFDVVNTTAASVTMPGSYLSSLGSHTVKGRITDKDGGFTNYSLTLNVVSLSITAKAANYYFVAEGGAVTTLYDKGSISNAAPIVNWEWDTSYSGNFTPRLTGRTALFSSAGIDGTSVRPIALRVTDALGNTAITTANIQINNTPPAISATPQGSVVAGVPATFLLSSADPGSDTISKWVIDWGDGTTAATYSGNPTTITHTYPSTGDYIANATVYDEDGTYTQTILGPGSIDPTFSVNGRFRDTSVANEVLRQTAAQPDGKVLQVGTIDVNPYGGYAPAVFRFTRLNSDGSLDSTFGTNGVATVVSQESPGSVTALTLYAITFQPDGKILFSGYDGSGFLMRLNSTGQIDNTFGNSGRISISLSSGLAVQSDGKILVVEFGSLYRYNSDGSPDTSFGTSGHTAFPLPKTSFGYSYGFNNLLVLPDDRIVGIGNFTATTSQNGSTYNYYALISQLTANGAADTTFGTGGYVINNVPGSITSPLSIGDGLKLANGKYVLDAIYTPAGGTNTAALFRFNPSGTVDTTFGSSGCLTISSLNWLSTIAEQADGKLLLNDQTISGQDVVRLAPDGAFDTTFGTNGFALFSSGSNSEAGSLAYAPDGGIYVTTFERNFSPGSDPSTFKLRSMPFTVAIPPAMATFSAPASVAEGSSSVDISFNNPSGGGPYTYSYDLDNDGIFEISDTTATSATLPASLLTDGPKTLVVRGRITGATGSSIYTANIQVTNVPPTVALNLLPAGKNAFDVISVSATATDPSSADAAAGFTFNWTVTRGSSPIASGSGNPFTFTPSAGGTYTVSVTATDKDGGQSVAASGDIVVNGPPTATFNVPAEVLEGTSAAVVSFSGQTGNGSDLSSLSYSYDFDDDGIFEITNSASSSATIPSSYLADGPGTITVHGRITGTTGFTDYTTTIEIDNVPPTVSLAPLPSNMQEGVAIPLQASASDPSSTDQAAGFTFNWTIKSGTTTVSTGTGNNFTFTPSDNGTYVVSVTATDKDGGTSAAASASATVANVAPTANFSGDATTINTPTTVKFTNQQDAPADTTAGFKYSYDFNNDGIFDIVDSTSSSATVPASYLNSEGAHTIAGRIRDKDGGSTTYTTTIQVTAPPPTAVFSGPASVVEGSTAVVKFTNGSGIGPFSYSYDFDNDGTFEITGSTSATVTVPAQYFGDGPSSRTIRGRIIAGDGQFTDYTTTISVTNAPPVVTLGQLPANISEGSTAQFTAAASDATIDTAAGFSFNWLLSHGNSVIASATGSAASFNFDDDGSYVLSVTATDKDGASSSAASATLVVANVAPTATLSGATVAEGSTASVTFGNQSDPSSADIAGGFTYSYDFNNDGTFDVVDSTSATASLPAALTADGPVTRIVRGRIKDKDGGFTDYTTQVNVSNTAPTVSINRMPISPVNEGSAVTLTASAMDVAADLPSIQYSWVVKRNNLVVVTGSGPTLVVPILDNGSYAVSVTATDKDGGSSIALANFIALNLPPSTTFSSGGSVIENTPGSVAFANMTDPSSADIAAGFTYSYDFDNDGNFEIQNSTASSVTVPASYLGGGIASRTIHGRITDKDGGSTDYTTTIAIRRHATALFSVDSVVAEGSAATASFSNSGGPGPFLYSYDFDNDGNFEIVNSTSPIAVVPASYLADGPSVRTVHGRITSADGLNNDYTADILVTNTPPIVSIAGTSATFTEGSPITLSAETIDVAADQSAMQYSWSVSKGNNVIATGVDAQFTFTPDDNGDYIAQLIATDKDGGVSAPTTATLNIVNIAPTATFTGETVAEGSIAAVSFSAATDPSPADSAAGFTYSYDFDNDGTFDVIDSPNSMASLPASLTADGPATRIVRGRIKDKNGDFNDYTATVNVTNVPPVLHIAGANSSVAGAPYSLSFSASDVGLDTITSWKITWGDGSSDTIHAAASTLTHAFQNQGNFSVVAVVTDEDGSYQAAPVVVNVTVPVQSSVPVDSTSPVASAVTQFIAPQAGASGYDFEVNYSDDTALNLSTIGDGNVLVTLPNGSIVSARMGAILSSTKTTARVRYHIDAPGGIFNSASSGTYIFSTASGGVKDTSGNAVAPTVLGQFNVNIPAFAVDLVTSLSAKPPAQLAPGGKMSAMLTVANAGNLLLKAYVDVSIAISIDNSTSNPLQVLITKRVKVSLKPGKATKVALKFSIPKTLSDGSYYLIGSAHSETPLIESNVLNNDVVGPKIVVTTPIKSVKKSHN